VQDAFYLVTHKKVDDKDHKCTVALDLRIVPKEFADKNEVGVGRTPPN
jgi:hypothetical protein